MTYKHDDPNFTEKVLKSLYADDLNAGVSSVQDGNCFYTKAKNVSSQTSFGLRKLQSNSTDLEILVNPSRPVHF